MIILGLTGGIACGKTVVTNIILEKDGFVCIDMDEIAREVVIPGTATYYKVIKNFPQCTVTHTSRLSSSDQLSIIDRKALGKIVFSDKNARDRLNRIMRWPLIWTLLKRIVVSYWCGVHVLIISAPLLFEYKLDILCRAVVVIFVEPEEEQILRLQNRDHVSPEEAQQKIHSQLPLEIKKARANFLIDNSRGIEETREQVEQLLPKLKALQSWLPRKSFFIYLLVLSCMIEIMFHFLS